MASVNVKRVSNEGGATTTTKVVSAKKGIDTVRSIASNDAQISNICDIFDIKDSVSVVVLCSKSGLPITDDDLSDVLTIVARRQYTLTF
jgi:hypothetical protein